MSALTLCALAAPARGLHGQTIRGVVRGAQTSESIGLVLVRAIEVKTGREIARVLTDTSGNFTLGAVAGEEFVLELRRVGIRRTTTAPMRLATGEVARPEIVVDEVVLPLGRVAVKTKSACGSDAERSVDVARLLDEIRTAVGVAELAASTLATDASVRLFRRVMDPQSGAIQSDSLSTLPGRYRWPFLGPSPQLLATSGYAIVNDDGGITFFAPDPRVLASAEFLETHCFSVTHKPTDSTRVGLSFRPLRGHRSTDVEGTVWIDRSTAEPRELEARYVRTPRSEYEARATATVRFARLADGRWIVVSWAIRSPVMTIARRPGGRVGAIRSPADERVEIVAMQEEGGFVEFGDGRFSPLGAITIETRTEGAPAGEVTLLLSGVGSKSLATHPRVFATSRPVDTRYSHTPPIHFPRRQS